MQLDRWLALAIVFATVLGPIAAVNVQRRLDEESDKRSRRFHVFRTLMATRSARVAPDHVHALNLIDIEFTRRRDHKVINAWKQYHDHLNTTAENDEDVTRKRWIEENDKLFIDLLYEMSQVVGYTYDKVQIKRGWYSPQAFGDRQLEDAVMRKGVMALLNGDANLPVSLGALPPPSAEQTAINEAIRDIAVGKVPLRVEVATGEQD